MTKTEPRFPLLIACFVLSGFAGLIYQTVWTQQFALVFGTSELALATVLAAYMAGLALGATLAARWISRVRRPILIYALLELGIGLAALAVPMMIAIASRLHIALLGGGELPEAASTASAGYYLGSSFLILLVPTTLMGATLPLLARQAVRTPQEIGIRIGALYAANTAGAAAGTLAAAYLLLPRIGLGPTVWVAAAVNLAVFALAVLLARGARGFDSWDTSSPRADEASTETQVNGWILPLILVSGAVSFTWEILWTRLLGHLLGGSVYAFATMLATFLVGLTLGSAVASRLATDRERARRGFAAAQIAIAGLSLAAFAAADRLPALARKLTEFGEWVPGGAALCAATLLPGAIAIGATFPFAVRILARDAGDAPRASARVFAWNTVGAIAGSLGTGYLLLPALKFADTAAVATAVSLALALAAALIKPRRWVLAAAATAGLMVVATVRPGTPWQVLQRGALGPQATRGEIVHYGVGRSATVLLHEQRPGWRLTTNGLPESFIGAPWQKPTSQGVAHWLTMLPFAARPETRSLLVIGLGGGVTAEDVPRSAEEVHVIELEPEVVLANRWAAERRRVDPLADPRLRLHINDARGALRLTDRRFDAIISQPSHPWTSGASHLFSREFLELVRSRLTEDGVFVQWMGEPFVDEILLRSLVATATEAFPHVELYHAQGSFMVLASAAPIDIGATAGRALEAEPRLWARLNVLCREDVFATRVLNTEGARRFAARGRASTDFLNLFRTHSPKILGESLKPAVADRILAPHEPLLTDAATDIERLYLVRRLIRQGNTDRARRLAAAARDLVSRQTGVGLVKLSEGDGGSGELELREALSLAGAGNPDGDEALHALLVARYRAPIRKGEPVAFVERFPDDPGAAVIAGWRAEGAGEWRQVRALEERLAAIGPRHPLFGEATRLRALWRAEGEAPDAAKAMVLLEPLLAPAAKPTDLLLYARAAASAERPLSALAAIGDAMTRFERGSVPAREAAKILRSLPPGEGVEEWRRELSERMRRPRGAMGS